MFFKISISILLLISSPVVSGCATIYNPATGHKEFLFITTPVEISLGNMLAAKIARRFKISNDKEKYKRLREIGGRITRVSDRQDLRYHLIVIEDKSLNAFATPGGYIYVNSGVLTKASDDELACVIGHEVGHIAARHMAKKLQAQLGYDILMNIAARKIELGDIRRAANLSFDLIMLGYSRGDELSADKLGVKYAYLAGFDPYAMVSFLKKLQETNKDEIGPVFLRSHPYASRRINLLKQEIPRIISKIDRNRKKKIPDKPAEVAIAGPGQKRPFRVMCPVCKKVFSGKFSYCPYDGTKLR